MNFSDYLPIWNELTAQQKQHIESASEIRKVPKGTILYNGNIDCLGLVLVRSGQIRAYILSEEGREVTISRFFEYDICFFSASCVMPSMQFNIVVEAEKDSEICIIPACLYKNLMDEYELDVLSAECWTATLNMFDGLAPCTVYSILNDIPP